MPAVLQRLMRHAQIATTMKYYVTMDADSVADELWGRKWEAGNTFGNNCPKQAPETETAPADESTEAVDVKQLSKRRAWDSNPQPLAGHLILHQGYERANHHARARQQAGGDLVAQRLAAAGGHNRKHVAAVQNRARFPLDRDGRSGTEDGSQRLGNPSVVNPRALGESQRRPARARLPGVGNPTR